MSTGEQQANPQTSVPAASPSSEAAPGGNAQNASSAIRDEVRKTLQLLNELARSEKDFDVFCDNVLTKVVKITGAHGALFWQVMDPKAEGRPKLTHQFGKFPSATARDVLSQENQQHNAAVLEVISKQLPMGLASEAFTGRRDTSDPQASRDEPFLLLFAPIYNRTKKCCGALELIQRGDISPQAQEGYLRFLTQISQLYQRWHEHQDLAKLSQSADNWAQRVEFINEVHGSIDQTETCYAIANEARRLLRCDRVSVGTWNGRRCKIQAISSQDRFDNRANVVRLLSNVATASVSADSPFWITGSTDGIAPEVATKINEYLDESHSRTLAVLPLLARPPATPDLEMKSKRKEKAKKLGVIVFEFFEADVKQEDIESDCTLVVEQSQLALENARKHGEIFLLPLWKRMGWLQQLLFRDHLAKTITGLTALAILTAAMIFLPWDLKMKVDGVMHPTIRKTIFAQTEGIVREVLIDEREEVQAGQPLLRLQNQDLEMQMLTSQYELKLLDEQIADTSSKLNSGLGDPSETRDLGMAINQFRSKQKMLQEQLVIMEKKQSLLEIKSPIAGTVVTPQPKRRFTDYPATANNALIEVVDLKGPWQLELKIPESDMAYVDEAFKRNKNQPLEVEFKIGTNPNLTLIGEVSNVGLRAVTDDAGAKEYRAIVSISQDQLDNLKEELRTGAGATAKIKCGSYSLGFVLLYQPYDYLRTHLFF